MSSFPIIQERSYSSAVFLGRPSFQDVRKKKIWFSVQCGYNDDDYDKEKIINKKSKGTKDV